MNNTQCKHVEHEMRIDNTKSNLQRADGRVEQRNNAAKLQIRKRRRMLHTITHTTRKHKITNHQLSSKSKYIRYQRREINTDDIDRVFVVVVVVVVVIVVEHTMIVVVICVRGAIHIEFRRRYFSGIASRRTQHCRSVGRIDHS